MKKTYIVMAHPNIENSRINKSLLNSIKDLPNITINELYKKYPDGKINIEEEQKQLLAHDNIILQYPLFWYSTPPLLKTWIDSTLAYGFAYGIGGNKLKDKKLQVVTSAAMSQKHYSPILWEDADKADLAANQSGGSEGLVAGDQVYLKPSLANKFGLYIMDAILLPLEQSCYHIKMVWQNPFITFSSIPEGQAFHAITPTQLTKKGEDYKYLINTLNNQ